MRAYQSKQQQAKLQQEAALDGTLQTDAWSCIAAQYSDLQDRARLRCVCKAALRLEIKLDMTSPTVVRLSGCRLGAGGVESVVRSLGWPANAAVETLELHSCRLGVEGALALAAGLRANPWMLRALSVSEVWYVHGRHSTVLCCAPTRHVCVLPCIGRSRRARCRGAAARRRAELVLFARLGRGDPSVHAHVHYN